MADDVNDAIQSEAQSNPDYLSQLTRLSEPELDKVAQETRMSPSTLNFIKSAKYAEEQRAPQEAAYQAENEAISKTPVGQQQAQQMADTAVNQGMQGTGVPTSFPPVAQQPLPPAPAQPATTLPSTLNKPEQDEHAEAAAQADAAEAAAAMHDNAKAKADMAVQVNNAMDQKQRMAAAADKDAVVTAKVKSDMDKDKSTWGSKIAQVIAIMMGAYSQGLTGSKTNPGLEAINDYIDKQAKSLKYNQEQKEKMFEQALKLANLEMERQKNSTDSLVKRSTLAKNQLDLQKTLVDLQQAQGMMSVANKGQLTQDEVRNIPLSNDGKGLRERLVRLPNGKFSPVNDSEIAKKLNQEYIPNTQSALEALNKLNQMADYFGDNPVKKFTSREEIAVANQNIQQLVGAIRPEYFGPGAFTDTEQKMARSLIGDPSKFASMNSATKAALKNMEQKMKRAIRSRITQAGGDLAPSINEQNVQIMKQRNPGLSESEIMDALQRTGRWSNEEF